MKKMKQKSSPGGRRPAEEEDENLMFLLGEAAAAGRRRLSFLGLGFLGFVLLFFFVKIVPPSLAENEGYL